MFGLAATNYHSEFFAKNFQKKRFSGKYGEILTQKNRTTKIQRKPEQMDALCLVCTVMFKYDYGNGAAGTHPPLRISQLFKLQFNFKRASEILKYGGNTVKYS